MINLSFSRLFTLLLFCIILQFGALRSNAQTATPTATPTATSTATNTPTSTPTSSLPVGCQSYEWCSYYDFTQATYGGYVVNWNYLGSGIGKGFWSAGNGWGGNTGFGIYVPFDYSVSQIDYIRYCYYAGGTGRGSFGTGVGLAYGTNGNQWIQDVSSSNQGGTFCKEITGDLDHGYSMLGIVLAASYTGSYYTAMRQVWIGGSGSSPQFTPTPTYTPVPTSTDQYEFLDHTQICPDAPVLAGSVSGSYARSCGHCLDYSVQYLIEQSFPTRYPTITPDPLYTPVAGLPTPTDVVRVSTVSPDPTDIPLNVDNTPYDFTCSWATNNLPNGCYVYYGSHQGSALIYDDWSDSFDYWNRGVSVAIDLPDDVAIITRVSAYYSLDMPTYTGLNANYRARNSSGFDIGSSWFDSPAGSPTDIYFAPNEEKYGSFFSFPSDSPRIELSILSARYLDGWLLDGSVSLSSVSIEYYSQGQIDRGVRSAWDTQDVWCSNPDSYPQGVYNSASDMFNIDLFSVDDEPICYSLFPGVDLSALGGVVEPLLGQPDGAFGSWSIPRIELCVYRVWVGDITVFGWIIPISFFLNAYLTYLALQFFWRF